MKQTEWIVKLWGIRIEWYNKNTSESFVIREWIYDAPFRDDHAPMNSAVEAYGRARDDPGSPIEPFAIPSFSRTVQQWINQRQ